MNAKAQGNENNFLAYWPLFFGEGCFEVYGPWRRRDDRTVEYL